MFLRVWDVRPGISNAVNLRPVANGAEQLSLLLRGAGEVTVNGHVTPITAGMLIDMAPDAERVLFRSTSATPSRIVEFHPRSALGPPSSNESFRLLEECGSMIATKAFAAQSAGAPLGPYSFARREPGDCDVVVDVSHCGVCHTDIHFVRNNWGMSLYPMVPGHEIMGTVSRVGSQVKKFKPGDIAAVGCLVDSCRECDSCRHGLEQHCHNGFVLTYSGLEKDGTTVTQGGYSTTVVVDQRFALKVARTLEPAKAAPLLCAGITTYSPLRRWGVGKNHRLAIVGLGGLGHMAVKFGRSFGAEVTVLSTSPSKKADAMRLGADEFVLTTDAAQASAGANRFDFILDTLSASHDYSQYVGMLKAGGTLICVGLPSEPIQVPSLNIVFTRKCIAGSLIGGLRGDSGDARLLRGAQHLRRCRNDSHSAHQRGIRPDAQERRQVSFRHRQLIIKLGGQSSSVREGGESCSASSLVRWWVARGIAGTEGRQKERL